MKNNIGVIDIGSNSVHLVVAKCYDDYGNYTIIDDAKVNVRLCEGLSETGRLSEERMALGEETLAMFARMCDAYGLIEVVAVATAAVRKAENGGEFVERIREKVGIEIQVIPGEMEAQMDYLGTINSIDIRDALLMDIGGGSVEFVLIKDRQKVDAISLPFGSIDLAEKFDLADVATPEKLDRLSAFLDGALCQYDLFKKAKGLPVLGVGGTIRNMGRIHRRALDYPLEIAHNYQMDLDAVKSVCKTAAELDLEGRRELKGLSKGRSDIFIGASHAVMMVMERIGSKSLIISDAGVRDGLIYTYFGRTEGDLIDKIFESSLGYAVDRFTVNIPHARHIYKLSDQLYTQLEPIHGVNGSLDRIRKTSAMLHDAGIMIQYNNHHEHSFYLILSAGINGLTQKELLMSAFVALNHRTQKKIKIDAIYTSMLDKKDLEIIDLLSLFLQIAEYLDRSMDGIVTDLSCDIQEDAVVLHVTSREASVFTDMIISECGKKFKRVMGKELVIENEIVK